MEKAWIVAGVRKEEMTKEVSSKAKSLMSVFSIEAERVVMSVTLLQIGLVRDE